MYRQTIPNIIQLLSNYFYPMTNVPSLTLFKYSISQI